MTAEIKILTSTKTKRLLVFTPYHPAMPARARALGGKWVTVEGKGNAWAFDARDESEVRRLVKDIYGWDQYEAPDLIQVVLRLQGTWRDSQMFLYGREIVSRHARDYSVRLGEGVILLEAKFSSRGGSAKHPAIGYVDGITLLIRDVPRSLVDTTEQGVTIFEADATTDQIRGVLAAQSLFGTSGSHAP